LGRKEVLATVRLYLAGKIDQWWYRQDGKGVVFLINNASREETRDLLESLPFAQAKLMRFDLVPLGPLAPLHALLRDGATEQPQVVMTAPETKKLAEAFIAAIRAAIGKCSSPLWLRTWSGVCLEQVWFQGMHWEWMAS
jgi:hypothetical protein